MRVAAVAGQVRERLRHEGRAQAVLLGDRLDHELEERMTVGGLQRAVVLPVHLELAVRVLVVVLVRPPAERDHAVADLGDGRVAAHQRLLVVAGLRLRVGAVRDRAAVGQDEKVFALDAGLQVVAVLRGVRDGALEHLTRVLRHRLAVHHQVAGDPRDLRLPRKLDRGRKIGHHQDVGMRGRHVEPHREAGEARAGLGHGVDRGRRHELRPHRAEQIDERDQEVFYSVLLRVGPKRRHRRAPFRPGTLFNSTLKSSPVSSSSPRAAPAPSRRTPP